MPAYNLFSRHRAGEIGCKSKGNVSHAECNVTTYPRTLQLANSITWFLGHVAPVVVLYASSIDISLSISFYLTISFLFYLYIRILPLIHSITLWLNTSCFIILLNQLYLLKYIINIRECTILLLSYLWLMQWTIKKIYNHYYLLLTVIFWFKIWK